MVFKLLEDIIILQQLLNGAIFLFQQVLDWLTALGPIVLPEVGIKESIGS